MNLPPTILNILPSIKILTYKMPKEQQFVVNIKDNL